MWERVAIEGLPVVGEEVPKTLACLQYTRNGGEVPFK